MCVSRRVHKHKHKVIEQDDKMPSDQQQQGAAVASTRFRLTDTKQVRVHEQPGENIWIRNRNHPILSSYKQNLL